MVLSILSYPMIMLNNDEDSLITDLTYQEKGEADIRKSIYR